jgi:hypothetical protein
MSCGTIIFKEEKTMNEEEDENDRDERAVIVPSKKKYEKPIIIENQEKTFPKGVLEEFCHGDWCFACSNCNCN